MILRICLLLLFATTAWSKPIRIVALGDSVTAGFGVAKQDAWPALLQAALVKKIGDVEVINAGVSGATTASAVTNLKWQLRRPFEVLILCLGGNDGLRGLKLKQSEQNLARAIELAQSKGIKVLLVGMKIPLNYGADYRRRFSKMYPSLAKKLKVPLMPFLLKGVGGIKTLNLPDGIHPNEKGYKIIAKEIQPFVEKLL